MPLIAEKWRRNCQRRVALRAGSPRGVRARLGFATGRSAAWLARLLWEQEAGGSNPPVPTSSNARVAAVPLSYAVLHRVRYREPAAGALLPGVRHRDGGGAASCGA